MAADLGFLIAAAGRGGRLGLGSKAFLALGGRTLLEWVVALGREVAGEVVAAVAAAELARARECVGSLAQLVVGGESRQETVRRMLDMSQAPVVLVHDVARPFATLELCQQVAAQARTVGAAVPLVPVADTVKRFEGEMILGTLPRARLGAAQTPQGFRREVLLAAHRLALVEGYVGTDDGELVERLGEPVAAVAGDVRNFKITTPLDWQLAQLLV